MNEPETDDPRQRVVFGDLDEMKWPDNHGTPPPSGAKLRDLDGRYATTADYLAAIAATWKGGGD